MAIDDSITIKALLPFDAFSFAKSEQGLVRPAYYVDKTSIIAELIRYKRVVCLCRPRRFGKTSTVMTIADIFANGVKNWQNCLIAQENSWQDKSYPVFFMSFADFIEQDIESFEHSFVYLIRSAALQAKVVLPEDEKDPRILMRAFFEKVKQPVAVLIDEYDLPLISTIDNVKLYAHIEQRLAQFYSVLKMHESDIRFMLVTGVNRVSNMSIFSGFNNIVDISLDPQYAAITGYTEQELLDNFSEQLAKLADFYNLEFNDFLEQLKARYNGYAFSYDLKATVFNTWDINSLLTSTVSKFSRSTFLPAYWAKIGSLSHFVIKYFAFNKERFLEFVEQASIEQIAIDLDTILKVRSFLETPVHIFMFNAGYLTLTKASEDYEADYLLDFPNQTIRNFVLDDLIGELASFAPDWSSSWQDARAQILSLFDVTISNEQRKAILSQIIIPAGVMAQDCFARESQLRALLIIMFKFVGLHVQFEVSKIGGRIDLLVIFKNIAFIIELKVFNSKTLKLKKVSKKDIAKESKTKKLVAFKQIKKGEYHYVVPKACKIMYFGALVGDCATGEITDFEFKTWAELQEIDC